MSERRKPADDHDEFERAMRDVVRLPEDPRGRVAKKRRPDLRRPAEQHEEREDSASDTYVAKGIDRRELRRLKRGEYAVRGRLDLHGMTVVEARASVARFLQNSQHAGHRCVSIVHGRGLRSAGGVPVLKHQVCADLTRAASVLAFAPAPPSDGGSGAVYVLLRK